MTFDFETPIDRRGSGSYKWDSVEGEGALPMWVADMDFKTAPAVITALSQRVDHGVFGYTHVPDAYYAAVTSWFARRYQFKIEKEWMLYTSGVVPAISAVIRSLTEEGDQVLVQTPVYNCFFSSIRNMGCEAVDNPLINLNGYYQIDFDDLESKLANPRLKVMLLCNPHNPVGRSWTRDELMQIGRLCLQYGVTVVSDEIHCDLVFPGVEHIAFASLSTDFLETSVTCLAPTKSFNMAGLQIANIVVKNTELREKIDKSLNVHEVCDVNPFGVIASMAAYNEGEAWLNGLRRYLHTNYLTIENYLADDLPQLKLTSQEATYLAWLDIRALGVRSDRLTKDLAEREALFVNSGTLYGEAGEGYLRLNFACPRSVLMEGLERLSRALQPYIT
ncbi:MalY/PatB family protein [Reinekea blandensis]|uniref:cysteine-S-conjugate beta-lyase n=1 Tax=Reinekea blandensis MED297 TaxID=314283 RepID=A4BDU4_9GAMM|nr:MalY/PatB family protein [Reinekea blandensis]EAR09703.1 putative aminotransferase B [Reinekea blandensis MED297]